jgi:calnexin
MSSPRSYSAISARITPPIPVVHDALIIQYEVRFIENVSCGGAYIKLFSHPNFSPLDLSNETRHFMMFGPDLCADKNRLVFYFHHQNPRTGTYFEKSVGQPPKVPKDNLSHPFTLVIRRNGTVAYLIDNKVVRNYDFLTSFTPPIIPPKEIPDPERPRPDWWDDREFIPDESVPVPEFDERVVIPDPDRATPPKGWLLNEEPFLPDPSAKRPASWDNELFGAWKPPIVENPKCRSGPGCGRYIAPLVANPLHKDHYAHPTTRNPKYSGKWSDPMIPNPEYFDDPQPQLHFPDVTGIGFELWLVEGVVGYNNILLASDEAAVLEWNEEFFVKRQKAQKIEENEANPTPTAVPIRPRTFGIWAPIRIPVYLLWRFVGEWRKLYDESPGATIALTGGCVVVLILIRWFLTRRGPEDEDGEESNGEEEEDRNK